MVGLTAEREQLDGRPGPWLCVIQGVTPLVWGCGFQDSQRALKFPFPQNSEVSGAHDGLASLGWETWLAEGPCPSQKGLQWVTWWPPACLCFGEKRENLCYSEVSDGRLWSVVCQGHHGPCAFDLDPQRTPDLCVLWLTL